MDAGRFDPGAICLNDAGLPSARACRASTAAAGASVARAFIREPAAAL